MMQIPDLDAKLECLKARPWETVADFVVVAFSRGFTAFNIGIRLVKMDAALQEGDEADVPWCTKNISSHIVACFHQMLE